MEKLLNKDCFSYLDQNYIVEYDQNIKYTLHILDTVVIRSYDLLNVNGDRKGAIGESRTHLEMFKIPGGQP